MGSVLPAVAEDKDFPLPFGKVLDELPRNFLQRP